jgi:hypothetical protein
VIATNGPWLDIEVSPAKGKPGVGPGQAVRATGSVWIEIGLERAAFVEVEKIRITIGGPRGPQLAVTIDVPRNQRSFRWSGDQLPRRDLDRHHGRGDGVAAGDRLVSRSQAPCDAVRDREPVSWMAMGTSAGGAVGIKCSCHRPRATIRPCARALVLACRAYARRRSVAPCSSIAAAIGSVRPAARHR